MPQKTLLFYRLRSAIRFLRFATHLFAAEPGEIDDVELLEDLVVVVDLARLHHRRRWASREAVGEKG